MKRNFTPEEILDYLEKKRRDEVPDVFQQAVAADKKLQGHVQAYQILLKAGRQKRFLGVLEKVRRLDQELSPD